MQKRPLFVHAGCSKTGTSALQVGLWRSTTALAEAGTGVPFPGRRRHRTRLLDPLGWRPAHGFVGPVDDAALDRTAERIAACPGDRLLVSNEELVELDEQRVERVLDVAERAGTEVHLVVTLRDWAQQIPSEHLQFLRHGMTETFPDFIARVRAREGRWGEHFWRRQDPLDILHRWRAVDPHRTTVVVVPSYSADPDGVFRMVSDVVGFPHALVERPDHAVNTSHGVVEAEVYRRLNAALPRSFADYSDAYRDLVRLPFSRGVLPTQASDRLLLPPEQLAWVTERAEHVVAELAGRRVAVQGDLQGLLPSVSRTGPFAPPAEDDVARVAVETLARFAEMVRRRTLEGAGADAAPDPDDGGRP